MPTSFGVLSPLPPTRCGVGAFTHGLLRGLEAASIDNQVGVVRVLDAAPPAVDAGEVIGHLRTDVTGTEGAAADALNRYDVAVIQYDNDVYGGTDGDQILAVLDGLRVPVLTVAHAVLAKPTSRQATIFQQVLDASDCVVTMTHAGRDRIMSRYTVDPRRLAVIPHGASVCVEDDFPEPHRSPLILTWGLLGPGKGIEWAIDGLRRLIRLQPAPTYVIAGPTHPRVRQQQGEAYRLQLKQRAQAGRVSGMLQFAGSHLDEEALSRLVQRADVVLLPYDSRDQVTSGALTTAIAAGKPVVATAFPHAVELLGSGAGLLVPQFDGAAIGEALYRVLTEPDLVRRMRAEAARIAPSLDWSVVAEQYHTVASSLGMNRTSAL